MKLLFEFERETKRCWRYKEKTAEFDDGVVGTLYVKKSALPQKPAAIMVTIEVVSDEASKG